MVNRESEREAEREMEGEGVGGALHNMQRPLML